MILRARTEKDKYIVTHLEDISPVLKKNYEDRKDPNKGFNKDRSYQKIASIPMSVWLEWQRKYPELSADWDTSQKFLTKLLNMDENKIFLSADTTV